MNIRVDRVPGVPACRDMDPDLFFAPTRHNGKRTEARGIALEACARCEVREWCLRQALMLNPAPSQQFGIVGGLTARQRKRLLLQQQEKDAVR